MNIENFDFGALASAVSAVAVSVVGLGLVISRFTKTEKDDKFFARLSIALGLRKG